jgi:hypothetical protein
MVTEGRCPSPPAPDAALVKAPLRIAGLLFVEAACRRRQLSAA